MNLQTKIPLTPAANQIDYSGQLLLLGSCFAENMGRKFDYYKFPFLQNPFGIFFHPLAIENLIEKAVREASYSEADVFFLNGRWHCFDAHSDLSNASQEHLIKNLNDGLNATRDQLSKSTHIIITLGTAWVYRNIKNGSIVANCHKVPQKQFSKALLSVNGISESLQKTMKHIRSVNENVQVIFTVSPIRHLKDGFIENQRSKAHLITSLDAVLTPRAQSRGPAYFPSYEIMMDELRDYRFYKSDMVHPNDVAVDYIWEKFKDVWISEECNGVMDQVEAIQKGLQHKPFHADSKEHKEFLKSLNTKITYLQQQYPFMEFNP
ncbi:MAG: GSCFA domain-containing protein [Maribacter sp.]|uniref:GSCFA domain-containing protein n=1 Tax=Maribacter sp. TaxID=1897614 RepID=UPI003C726CB9